MSLNVLTQGGGAGGKFASIFVTGLDENSTVAAVKDGKTVQGKWNSAENRFEISKIKEYGMYTVTATNEKDTATQDVLVDAAVEFEIEMSYVLWLYREGDECEDITGGWVLENGGGGSLTKNADHMVLYHNYNTSAVYTKNTAISNPKYRTFCAEIKAEQSPFNQKNFVSQYSSSSSLYSEITSTAYYKQTIDISSTVGSPFYVRFYGQYWGATSSGRIYIKNVWLE